MIYLLLFHLKFCSKCMLPYRQRPFVPRNSTIEEYGDLFLSYLTPYFVYLTACETILIHILVLQYEGAPEFVNSYFTGKPVFFPTLSSRLHDESAAFLALLSG